MNYDKSTPDGFPKRKLTRVFYSDYTYVLHLRLGAAKAAYLKSVSRSCALVYNKSLELQHHHFTAGFKEPLTPLDLRVMVPIWQKQPGLGFLERSPKPIVGLAIADCCRDVREPFNDRREFKFPAPLENSYKHLEFLRGVVFNQELKKLRLYGWEDWYGYDLVKADACGHKELFGKVKKVWVIHKDNKWLVFVWTRPKSEAGLRAAPNMLKVSKRRIGEIQPFIYAENHWLVNAHKKRVETNESYGKEGINEPDTRKELLEEKDPAIIRNVS